MEKETFAYSHEQGSKVALLFVFLTVLIGSSAMLPTSVFQQSRDLLGTDESVTADRIVDNDIQTSRYLKMPSRF